MLKIEQLNFSYGDKKVLNGVNLEGLQGEIHGILGVNGAGKTTLFRCMYGFLKPASGQIQLNEAPLGKMDTFFLETENFFYSYMKGREYLEVIAGKKINTKRWNMLFDLPLENFVETYSIGMKKKLAILGMLIMDRPVLILDEPFNGLDLESQEKMFSLMDRLKAQRKIIFISSHTFPTLTRVCDRISYLEQGIFKASFQKPDYPILEAQLKDRFDQHIKDTLDGLF